MPGNLQGIHLAPQPTQVMTSLAKVSDYRPSLAVAALHAPLSAREPPGPATWMPASASVVAAVRPFRPGRGPHSRPAPSRRPWDIDPTLDIVRWRSLANAAEAFR